MNNNTIPPEDADVIQQAVAARVGRLSTMPVDTSRLDQLLRTQIPVSRRNPRFWIFGSLAGAGVAACAAAIIAMAILFSGTPRLSAADLANVYQNMAGQPALAVTGSAATSKLQMAPGMICPLKAGETASCCQQMVGQDHLACVAVRSPSHAPVVMVAGNAGMVKGPRGQAVTIGGCQYTLDQSGHINMLMRRAGNHWYCAMGSENPATLASYLQRLTPRVAP